MYHRIKYNEMKYPKSMRLRNFSVLFLPLTKACIDFDVYWIQTDSRGKYIYSFDPRGGGALLKPSIGIKLKLRLIRLKSSMLIA